MEMPQRRRLSLFPYEGQKRTADLLRVGLICSLEDSDSSKRRSAIQLQIKTILNRVQHFVGFVYRQVRLHCSEGRPQWIEITLQPHGGIRGRCSQCRRPAPGYDRLPERRWLFVPLWGIPTYFCYAPRRVECATHGVVVEYLPWSDGKRCKPSPCSTELSFLCTSFCLHSQR